MKIKLWHDGPMNDEGSRFSASTVVTVSSDQEAELAGQEFARLCKALFTGAVEYQRAAWGVEEDPS